ncbi:hypothetical protein TNCV_1673371 [Trichonephila clavipes]|nr:hypothetical protein TNCV_1673371 [Trichonephila clavipes]
MMDQLDITSKEAFSVVFDNDKIVPKETALKEIITSTQDRYLELSARRLRQITAPQLAHDFVAMSGRRISRQTSLKSSCRDYPLCLVSSLVHPFDCIQQERMDI